MDRRRINNQLVWRALVVVACTLGSFWLLLQLTPLVRDGLSSLRFERAEGLLLEARHTGQYWPSTSGKSKYRQYVELRYAYTARGPTDKLEQLEAWAFDAASMGGRSSWVTRSPVSPWVALLAMRRAPEVSVYYDRAEPQRALLVRGLPLEASVWFIVLAGLLGTLVRVLRGVAAPEVALRAIAYLGLFSFGGLLLCLGSTQILAETLGRTAPAWLLLGYGVTGGLALAARDWRASRALAALVPVYGLALAASLLGVLAVALFTSDESPVYRVEAAELRQRVRHAHPLVREHSLRQLRDHPTPESLSSAIEALTDQNRSVSGAAIHVVQRLARHEFAGATAVTALVSRLEDPDEELAKRAAWALINVHAYQPRVPIRGARPGATRLLAGSPESRAAALQLLPLLDKEFVRTP